mgnify:CR=1 FL=1
MKMDSERWRVGAVQPRSLYMRHQRLEQEEPTQGHRARWLGQEASSRSQKEAAKWPRKFQGFQGQEGRNHLCHSLRCVLSWGGRKSLEADHRVGRAETRLL